MEVEKEPVVFEEIGEDATIYQYDEEAQNALNATRPWKEDPYSYWLHFDDF